MPKIENPSFFSADFETGLIYDNSDNKFPSKLYSWKNDSLKMPCQDSTSYIYCWKGDSRLYTENHTNPIFLEDNMWACVTGEFEVSGGQGIIMERLNFTGGMYQVGGPMEAKGRYLYIDGCSDSLIIPPIKKGDPCLNLLYFPPRINQTMHTHPSMRVGMVVYGGGNCITPWRDIELYEGQIFLIHEGHKDTFGTGEGPIGEKVMFGAKEGIRGAHCFQTFDKPMIVVAYHPDSDYGPTDDEHPMINKTFIGGERANEQTEIRSKVLHEDLF